MISYATFFVAGVNLANGQSLGYAWIEFPSTWAAFFGAFLDYCLHPRAGKEERHRAMEQLNRKGADFLALPMFINWIGSGNYDVELATPNWALPSVDMSTFHHVMFFLVCFSLFSRIHSVCLWQVNRLHPTHHQVPQRTLVGNRRLQSDLDQAGSLFWRL